MSQNAKKIRELENKIEELDVKLSGAKIELGASLLAKDSLFVEYTSAQQRLEAVQSEGNDLEAKLKGLSDELSGAKTDAARLEKELDTATHLLGQYLFEHADQSVSEAFPLHNKVREIESDLDRIEAELNAASFFKKLPMQVKRGSLLSNLATEKKKLEQLLDRRAKTIVQEQLVSETAGGTQYAECRHIYGELSAVQAKTAELTAAKAEAEAAQCKNREEEAKLKQQLQQQKVQCDEKALAEGDSYAAQYIGEKGEKLKNFTKTQKTHLEAVYDIVLQMQDSRRDEEILRIEDAVFDCNSQIDRMQSEYEANQRAISQLQERNARLLDNINGSKSLIENYEGQRAALEAEKPAETKHAESKPAEPETTEDLQ